MADASDHTRSPTMRTTIGMRATLAILASVAGLAMMTGCAGRPDDGTSSITTYGTVDAGVSLTRDK